MAAPRVQAFSVFTCAFLLLCCSSEAPDDQLGKLKLVPDDPSDLPLTGLSADLRDRFLRGDALFEHQFSDARGLGPVFIRQSCNSCHEQDGRSPGAVRKMVLVNSDGR